MHKISHSEWLILCAEAKRLLRTRTKFKSSLMMIDGETGLIFVDPGITELLLSLASVTSVAACHMSCPWRVHTSARP